MKNKFWKQIEITTFLVKLQQLQQASEASEENSSLLIHVLKWSLFTMSKTDRQLLRQKVRQRISVMKMSWGQKQVVDQKSDTEHKNNGDEINLCQNTKLLLIFTII